MKHVVMFSGGVASWCVARRVVDRHGTENLTLLFADTCMEDEDLYRFLEDGSKALGVQVTTLRDGRTPWRVFHDERFLGNAKIDPCSKLLKRKLLDAWRNENCRPEDTTVYLGFDWTEEHRLTRLRERVKPWNYRAPLLEEEPYLDKRGQLRAVVAAGLQPPRLYAMGFPHNNCGGFCVKGGHAHFKRLLRELPERYAFHEAEEERLRVALGKDVSILKHRSGPEEGKPMTLRAFREHLERNGTIDEFDWGACSCLETANG